jgi:hypothetical protein
MQLKYYNLLSMGTLDRPCLRNFYKNYSQRHKYLSNANTDITSKQRNSDLLKLLYHGVYKIKDHVLWKHGSRIENFIIDA